ncbi:response regulator [Bradyrhizobium liaoningense]|uniref:response regulator n=1 Tax=Bradyrhizobium liaoningense TaxID=43992 RepID=UPI001BADE6EF|nr:response regulator [Bradyrhizobium liaoningense]MBR0719577.1 response regulator [Bradyrhizobium liaoningense]
MVASPTLSREGGPLSGRRILVVEDEYFLADDIGRALRSFGADVAGPVGDLDDALRIVSDGGILHGAVLDVNIRSEMIYPIAEKLRARGIPMLFATGYDKMTLGPEFRDVLLCEKPLDVAAIVRGLAGLISHEA